MKHVFSLPRGTADILPDECARWVALEQNARRTLGYYGYQEIRTPIFEETDLFTRSVGETSDIVQKQMLNLAAPSNSESGDGSDTAVLSLRPEGTAAVVRSYIQNRFDRKEPLSKLFYIGPMFRGERPQKGRLRQFHQIGVEAIGAGSASPLLDAEVISLCLQMLKSFGLQEFSLKLNTLGTKDDKQRMSMSLRKKVAACLDHLCLDCRNRYERNVFRILDCKNQGCRKVVQGLTMDYDYLAPDSRNYFESVKTALNHLGVMYVEDPYLVRGLDYYTHTVFEISCPQLGSQDAVGAGGRYDNLVQQLGGPDVDAVGFALGMERILLAIGDQVPSCSKGPCDVFVVALGEAVLPRAFALVQGLRAGEVAADIRYSGGSLKSQMRQADKLGCAFVAIIGEAELADNSVIVKDMKTGQQSNLSLDNINIMIKIFKGLS